MGILACFFEGVVGAICCSGIFEFWTNFAPEILQEIDKIGPRMPQGRPKLVQGGTPQRFRKTGREQEHHRRKKLLLLEPTWVRKSPPKKRLAANSVKNNEKLQKVVYRKWHEFFMKMSYEMEGLGR